MLITHLYMLISGVVLAVVYVVLTEFILSPQQPLNLGKGGFLLATEVPNDHDNRSIWSESVILLLSHSRSGAKGVIINQPHYDFDVDVDVETLLPPPSPPEGNIGRTHRLISTNAAAHGLFTTAECAASQSPIFGSHYLKTYASANVWPPGWGTAETHSRNRLPMGPLRWMTAFRITAKSSTQKEQQQRRRQSAQSKAAAAAAAAPRS